MHGPPHTHTLAINNYGSHVPPHIGHQKFLAGILNLGSKAVFCENMREDRGLERGKVEKWRFLIKSGQNVVERYNGLGPNLKEGHLCTIYQRL